MEAKIKHSDGISHARYAINRQIYAADTYPFSAPGGSNVIVCGHENGLLILWRGGRGLKTHGRQSSNSEDVDMNVYEGEEEEDDETGPEDSNQKTVLHKLELPLGTSVLHLAFPQLPQSSNPLRTPVTPVFLQTNLVVALICGDNSIKVLTIPLQAPADQTLHTKRSQQIGKGSWGEKLVNISNAHQNLPQGVSIAFAPHALTRSVSKEDDESDIDILVASHSADLTGTLLVHRIAVAAGNTPTFGQPELWRSRPLSSPATSIDLFVPPNFRTGPKILVSESKSVARVFDCISERYPSGSWTLSLFVPNVKVSGYSTTSIYCAKWVLGGRAVIVLTSDGNWGIWDISNGGAARGLSGAQPTPFTISGKLGFTASTAPAKSSSDKAENRSQLAPMTPGTRKIRQEALFSGKIESSTKQGGITIRLTGHASGGEADESLIFWHGDSIAYLPSLRTHWQNKFKGGNNILTTSTNGHIRDIPSMSLGGEARVGVSVIPSDTNIARSGYNGLDILVAGNRSLVISSAEPEVRLMTSNKSSANQSRMTDQSLLSRGLLDVQGLDRVLDGMRTGNSSGGVPQKRVLFE